jgi:tRNA(Ile)-lysidine synthase
VKKKLLDFALTHNWEKKKFLIALSGGVDSSTLLHLCLEIKEQLPFTIEVAHVDHGWREESKQEAKLLQEMCVGIPFFMTRLVPAHSGNLENVARKERYRFFFEMIRKRNLDGLILGHHKDDLIETSLKRILEGASLVKIGSMKPFSVREGISLFRPFLEMSKKEIEEYAQKKKIFFFQDRTNEDKSFLRARMRMELLPQLNTSFGKNIRPSLAQIAKQSWELEEYLTEKTQPFFESQKSTPWGFYWDFSEGLFHPFELSFFIQKLCEKLTIVLSRIERQLLCDAISRKIPGKTWDVKGVLFFCDRGHLLVQPNAVVIPSFSLKEGITRISPWRVEYKPDASDSFSPSHWKNWLFGELKAALPYGDYYCTTVFKEKGFSRRKIFAKLAKMGIPSFMRSFVPILINEEKRIIIPFGAPEIVSKNNKQMRLKITIS